LAPHPHATLAGSMPSALSMSARPAAYPPWFAQRCIYLWYVEGETKTAVAKMMGCDRHTVARFVERWEADEPLQAPGQTGSIRDCRIMDAALTADMLELVRRRNDLFLPEIAQELFQLHGVMPSVCQVCRALRANGITRKKLHKRAQEAQVELQEAFKELVKYVPLEHLYFIDESAVDNRDALRAYGWAPSGQRTTQRVPWLHSRRKSVLPLVSGRDGVLDYMVVDGSLTGELMGVFARDILCTHLGPGDVLVLDNATIHSDAYFKGLVRGTGATLVYNAPYSPELQPIEHCFSQMKSWFKTHDALARTQSTEYMIHAALSAITPANVYGYVKHDWRAFWDPR